MATSRAATVQEYLHELPLERRAVGKKLDLGKSCLRFRGLDDLPLDAVGEAVAGTPPDRLIAHHQAARAGRA